eukprot:CAMPEP_0176002760 /NCGR_PEP_ID=MMETSP0120_2-20121206/817_1 /TAXON_ID=160619 /ORGANISM="Kryptoperidinium foliaceum, Strain CCMP 1326" /LENGTH=442 /DNA_ID=CAMNT_0017335367 /DNA_START=145 /DNA_END=1470 /DNA_ORIENTATION=+
MNGKASSASKLEAKENRIPESKRESSKQYDGAKKNMLIRMLYVAYYAANGFLHPFIPEYYAWKGFGGKNVGILGSLSPFITFLVGPMWGVISDSWQAPYFILYTTMTVTLAGQILVAAIDNPYVIMGLVSLKSIFVAPTRSIIDSLVLHHIHDRKSFGRMRLWGLIGSGIGTSLGGYFLEDATILKMSSWGDEHTMGLPGTFAGLVQRLAGYPFLFFAHAMLHIPLFLVMRWLQKSHLSETSEPEPKTEATASDNNDASNSVRTREILWSVAKNRDAIIFFLLVYAMGVAGGVADNFTYARFREMGASSAVMGSSRLFSSTAGAIMFWFSGDLSALLGTNYVMLLSLLLVSLRFWLYASVEYSWTAYLGEALRGLTFGCYWSSATVSASELAPKEARSTMLLILNGAYNGIGRSTGAIAGGYIESISGSKAIFQCGYLVYLA